jgi:ribonuclease G
VIKSEETIAIETGRHLRHLVQEAGVDGPEAYLVRINPRVSAWFTGDGARELQVLEADTGRWFHFEGSEGLPLDHFAVTQTGSRDEIEERAVPFRAGEEVHVDIVEPHMYDPDAAVAKVDGYLITVPNGLAFVGEKKLVRIEEARRTSATAVLTGADAEAAEAAAVERAQAREKSDERARRSAAAKKGAAKRKARQEAEKATEADAVEVLADDDSAVPAGTGPSVVEEIPEPIADGEEKPKRRSRRGGRSRRRRSGEGGGEGGEGGDATADSSDRDDRDDRDRDSSATDRESAADDAPDSPAGEGPEGEAGEEGDALSSSTRRRGRRGGRRRSRAKAPADAEVTE